MMKHSGKTLLALTLASPVAGMAQAVDNKVLHVYNWSDYVVPDTLEEFIKETGVKVAYDIYDSNEIPGAKLSAGKSGYDVVVSPNFSLVKQIKARVYQKPDESKLPSQKNLSKDLMHTPEVSDPRSEHVVSYMWGIVGIGYNLDKIKTTFGDNAPMDSWDLIFKSKNIQKLKQYGISFLDLPTEILPTALYYLGYKPDTDSPKEPKAAKELFLKTRPNVTYFHSSRYISGLVNGNICVAIGYSGGIYQAKSRVEGVKNKVTVKYNIPRGGAGNFFDMVAISKGAENIGGALAFVNSPTESEIMAEITDVVQFPSGNAAAIPLVSEAICNDPDTYPSERVMRKLYTFPDLPVKTQRVMIRSWTKIKSGK